MTNPVGLCSDERLQMLLLADEESAELQDISRHVADCASCQTRLEQLAGSAEEWHETRDHLIELSSTVESPETRYQYPSPQQKRPIAWTETLAQQLLSPPSHPEMLGRIGRYEVERLIGSGGMGVVFKAFDTELNRPVAIKVLAPYLAGNGAARKRFAREARAAAAVVHEHVVPIHNVESDGAAPFLVMHYVQGESLQQRLDREGPLELCEILRIAMQTASGLAAAHAQGLVHRDVKPSNILLEERVERALLTDFGLARAGDDASLTHTGYHPGTPQYMSPEQARGDSVDTRSDLFSLGSCLYVMCTGRLPFRAESTFGILRRITDTEPRPIREINPQIPEWLVTLILRLHAKGAEQRFQTADQVRELLERCLAHVQQPQAVPLPDSLRTRTNVQWRKLVEQSWLKPVLGAVALFGVVCAAIPYLSRDNPRDATDPEGVQTSPAANSSSSLSDPALHWDQAETQVSALSQDVENLEQSLNTLWETPSSREGTPDTNVLSE